MEPQAVTLLSLRLDTGDLALDFVSSDPLGAYMGRDNGTSTLPLQDEVGPVRTFIGPGKSIAAYDQGHTRLIEAKTKRTTDRAMRRLILGKWGAQVWMNFLPNWNFFCVIGFECW